MPNPAAPRFADRAVELPAPVEFAALSGMEIMRGVLTRRLPSPPIGRTLAFRLAEVSEGRVAGDAAHVGWLADAAGRLYAQGSATCPIFDY